MNSPAGSSALSLALERALSKVRVYSREAGVSGPQVVYKDVDADIYDPAAEHLRGALATPKKTEILSIGSDEMLLSTRQLVLESAGFAVRSIGIQKQITAALVKQADLVLLCHSVAPGPALVLAHYVQQLDGSILICQLSSGFASGCLGLEQIEGYMPQLLLRELDRIVRRNKTRQSCQN